MHNISDFIPYIRVPFIKRLNLFIVLSVCSLCYCFKFDECLIYTLDIVSTIYPPFYY